MRLALGHSTVYGRSGQLGFWRRPVVRGEKSWKRRHMLGLPIPHVRGVLSERLSRSRLLQREPVARPGYRGGAPKTSKKICARPLGRPAEFEVAPQPQTAVAAVEVPRQVAEG